ncbi:CD276 antigen homolog isoform X1 [Rhinichthys klamathensis goyatoka]|uniref:CD276 antigen homolog isoform X1 n=1 Tax=Rhinichthys klamathensis goyatoka TaxID=3034132 RepID=UPI0024B566A3|nr:CD276 antigen homolog isoform X1 [Rhinichthys klamathensis goyatoka]
MVIGCCFICVFAVLINKVSLQVTVKAVIGGSVLLPCSSTEHDLKPQDTDVHWRHNGSKLVYDIVKGEDSLQLQHPLYKNRAERLPDVYERGNFSIKLNNLTHTDAGKYTCIITHSSELQTVLLIINESTAGKESKSTDHENPEDETGSDSVETSLNWLFILLIVLSISILPIGCLIVYYCRREKKQALSFSSVLT